MLPMILFPHRHGEGRVWRSVRHSDDLPNALRRRGEQMVEIVRWLTGYFVALGLILQIPGGHEFHYADFDPVDDDKSRDADGKLKADRVELHKDDLFPLIWRRELGPTHDLLAAALTRLHAAPLLEQVPGLDRRPRALPRKVRQRVDALDRMQLLNLVAECLDRLLVIPHDAWHSFMLEIDRCESAWDAITALAPDHVRHPLFDFDGPWRQPKDEEVRKRHQRPPESERTAGRAAKKGKRRRGRKPSSNA